MGLELRVHIEQLRRMPRDYQQKFYAPYPGGGLGQLGGELALLRRILGVQDHGQDLGTVLYLGVGGKVGRQGPGQVCLQACSYHDYHGIGEPLRQGVHCVERR